MYLNIIASVCLFSVFVLGALGGRPAKFNDCVSENAREASVNYPYN